MPGRDYYGLLGIERSVTASEVKAGYRWAAMKWHPQKNPGAKAEAEQRFRDIAEAYDVLIDPLRRKRYDDLGERGIKFPPSGSNFEPYQYVGDPFALFAEFFAEANPLAAAYQEDLNGFAPSMNTKEVDKSIEVELACSLAELQDGQTRRVVVQRTRLGPGNKPYTESKPVTLPVRAGWQAGMRVVFKGEGNHTSVAKQPGDLIVVITEKAFPGDASQKVDEEAAQEE
mmetsp:Transcript_992/g.2218  ORF Transcript_992/g.2218 Transcript_992/m.2218 type:complete len:228 (-) Transcript_992:92-775(-)